MAVRPAVLINPVPLFTAGRRQILVPAQVARVMIHRPLRFLRAEASMLRTATSPRGRGSAS